jgi:sodium/hydrogen exchanger-like protein 6/7/sodium/hydrogen exchanger 8
MLFEDGYNIRKRKFFQNIFYINLYGVLGTVVNFLVMFGIFYGYNYFGNELCYL